MKSKYGFLLVYDDTFDSYLFRLIFLLKSISIVGAALHYLEFIKLLLKHCINHCKIFCACRISNNASS